MSKIKEVSQDLRDTLLANEQIEKVHFTKTGNHYFNVHEYEERVRAKDGSGYSSRKTGKFYGHLLTEIVEETVNLKGGAIDKKMKLRLMPNPKAEIVETLTREEVLALPVYEEEMEDVPQPQLPQQRRPGKRPYNKKKTETTE
jgi:hypothetical protein